MAGLRSLHCRSTASACSSSSSRPARIPAIVGSSWISGFTIVQFGEAAVAPLVSAARQGHFSEQSSVLYALQLLVEGRSDIVIAGNILPARIAPARLSTESKQQIRDLARDLLKPSDDQKAARRNTEDGAALKAIAPTGTLRVAFLGGNPTQGKVDAKTGAVSGPVKDLSEELGRKLGVPVSVTPLNGVPAVLESLKAHKADIGFAAIDPTRATEVDFSQPYLLGWSSYIVPAGSALRSVKDVDRAGVRVAANVGDAPDLFLSRNLKNATLTHLKSMDEVLAALARGEIAGYATNRQRLLQIAAEDSRLRVLEDNFFAVEQAIAVPKGNAAALEIVNRFLDDAKASGFLRGLIDRAGLAPAVDPAPPRK